MLEQVALLLQRALEERKSLFLIDLSISENNQIRVVIDGDNGVKVQDCIEISRAIEHNLDRDQQDFSLEVLSAGVSEPLKSIRQYKKNLGRKLKVKSGDETMEGTLTDVSDDTLTLEWKTREPKPVGKGKVTVRKEAVIPYDDITEAKVMITF